MAKKVFIDFPKLTDDEIVIVIRECAEVLASRISHFMEDK